MYKKTVCIMLCTITLLQSYILDPGLLTICPSEYLIDIMLVINTPEATLQVGQQLYKNNYAYVAIIYEQISGRYDDKPIIVDYTHGTLIWIADDADSEDGTWCFIAKTEPYYITYLESHTVHITDVQP